MKKLFYLFLLIWISSGIRFSNAQTFDLMFEYPDQTQYANGDIVNLKVFIKANTTPFGMGVSNLAFNYNNAALMTPISGFVIPSAAANYSAPTANYGALDAKNNPASGAISINISYTSSGLPSGQTVPTGTWVEICTIPFTVLDNTQTPNFEWIPTGGGPPQTVVFSDIPVFIPNGTFIDITPGNVLPVKLSSLEAEWINSNKEEVLISWVIESQINNDYFTVEKSSNLNEWELVGYMDVADEFSTYNGRMEFSLIDKTPYENITYYKLSQTDIDGESEMFHKHIIYVSRHSDISNSNQMKVYPNPAVNNLNVDFVSDTYSNAVILITDMKGEVIVEKDIEITEGANNLDIEVSKLQTSVYHLRIISEEFVLDKIFIKQ